MNTEGGRLAGGESKEEHGGPEIESRKGIEQMGVPGGRLKKISEFDLGRGEDTTRPSQQQSLRSMMGS